MNPSQAYNGSNIVLHLDATSIILSLLNVSISQTFIFSCFKDQQITYTIQAKIFDAYQKFIATLLEPLGVNPTVLRSPVLVRNLFDSSTA
jgi:hypothetical protein